MQLHRLSSTAALAALVCAPLALAQDAPIPKQLAGPPSEFSAMRPADPAAAAIHSKSALLQVELQAGKSGVGAAQLRLPVEGERLRMIVFSDGADWDATLSTPSGMATKSGGIRETTSFGIGEAHIPVQRFDLPASEAGEWTLALRGDATKRSATRGFVLMEGEASTQLVSHRIDHAQKTGDRIAFNAMLAATPDDGVALGKGAGRIVRATLQVTLPNGTLESVQMFDDGMHQDARAGDGIYGGAFLATEAGEHIAQVVVHGSNRHGAALLRTAEHVVAVVEPSVHVLQDRQAMGAHRDAGRIAVSVPVEATKALSHYRAWAEVWGQDGQGNALPVAWIGGMVSPAKGALALDLDERWVARSGAQAPFELRNLRIEHPDNFATVASSTRLPLVLPQLRTKRGSEIAIAIDDSMRMGTPPAQLAQASKGVGKRLLLVHGYCSGGVWPSGQFSTASTFLDANQNRTHDQFAQRISTFGNTWNSYGIVAHSQGGAAALHLYAYYWSGLDNATGNRLIQSVGTPYQGTNLAGIIAAVGSWFGAGCGSNNNLSYNGAAAWLAGVPTWARAKVNYYTTAFRTTNWWTNDYCHFASDLVLNDPEDGTVERSRGQLSGAINRGHATGQCHTTGMRDPAQYQNASRNSTMNSNAAR